MFSYFISIKFIHNKWNSRGLDSKVDIVIRYGLDGPRVESWWGKDCPSPNIKTLGLNQHFV
jgi:hypothetical protein